VANQPSPLSNLSAKPKTKYVSRGGLKLRGALEALHVSVDGKACLDVGSSTGGFTDCLLQTGARSVWAVDVGWGLLDYNLRKDPRVHVLERTNFRHFDPSILPEKPNLATVDVSFISLDKILPNLWATMAPGGEALVLVKPQFEGSPKQAPGGVVKEEGTRQEIIDQVKKIAKRIGFQLKGTFDSEVSGRKGNRETFLYLVKP
jgi:23S rRNA (cytidine1920-2'-O)/16S rRNA (cytidine1409-2'-O)-methyltransferase